MYSWGNKIPTPRASKVMMDKGNRARRGRPRAAGQGTEAASGHKAVGEGKPGGQ